MNVMYKYANPCILSAVFALQILPVAAQTLPPMPTLETDYEHSVGPKSQKVDFGMKITSDMESSYKKMTREQWDGLSVGQKSKVVFRPGTPQPTVDLYGPYAVLVKSRLDKSIEVHTSAEWDKVQGPIFPADLGAFSWTFHSNLRLLYTGAVPDSLVAWTYTGEQGSSYPIYEDSGNGISGNGPDILRDGGDDEEVPDETKANIAVHFGATPVNDLTLPPNTNQSGWPKFALVDAEVNDPYIAGERRSTYNNIVFHLPLENMVESPSSSDPNDPLLVRSTTLPVFQSGIGGQPGPSETSDYNSSLSCYIDARPSNFLYGLGGTDLTICSGLIGVATGGISSTGTGGTVTLLNVLGITTSMTQGRLAFAAANLISATGWSISNGAQVSGAVVPLTNNFANFKLAWDTNNVTGVPQSILNEKASQIVAANQDWDEDANYIWTHCKMTAELEEITEFHYYSGDAYDHNGFQGQGHITFQKPRPPILRATYTFRTGEVIP